MVPLVPTAAEIELAFYERFLFGPGLEPYPVQESAFGHIFAGDSVLVTVPTGTGKTSAHTDTYHGRFVRLVANEQVVEVMEFETDDEAMRGEMTVTLTLTDADDGTEVLAVHDNVPPAVAPADNEMGWRMALEKLARLVEAEQQR